MYGTLARRVTMHDENGNVRPFAAGTPVRVVRDTHDGWLIVRPAAVADCVWTQRVNGETVEAA